MARRRAAPAAAAPKPARLNLIPFLLNSNSSVTLPESNSSIPSFAPTSIGLVNAPLVTLGPETGFGFFKPLKTLAATSASTTYGVVPIAIPVATALASGAATEVVVLVAVTVLVV